ncbi:hypothetical protein [Altererythrobacter sp.]|uniref:hypothetical protein n=1 Tax=Altererythrobacter sp. TaxID=1872480 RepID=UPI003CFD01A1
MSIDVSQVISKTLGISRSRFGSLAGLWFVFFVIQVLFVLIAFGVLGSSINLAGGLGQESPFAGLGTGMFLFLAIFYLGYLAIYAAQAVSMSRQASPLLAPDFGQAMSVGFRGALPFLGVVVLLLIAYFLGALLFGAIVGVLSLLGSAVAAIGLIVGIPLLIYLACRLSVLPPIIGVEGVRNPITAITRSWVLTSGKVLGIFLSMLIFAVLAILLLAIPFGVIYSLTSDLASGEGASSPGLISFVILTLVVFGIAVAVVSAALVSVIHGELASSGGEQLTETFE